MAAKRGSSILWKRHDGTSMVTLGSLQSKSVSFDGGDIDITTDDEVDANGEVWGAVLSGTKTISISGTLIAKAQQPIQGLYDDYARGLTPNHELVLPYLGVFTVPMLISSLNPDGEVNGVYQYTVSARNNGAPTFVAET